MNDKHWYLKQCSVFAQLQPEQIAAIEPSCFVREFARGETIYLPSDMGDSALLLARGRVRIYHITTEGKQAILGFVESGELFGELSAFDGSRRDEYAETTEKSLVVMLPRQVMQTLMMENPSVSMKLTRLFGFRLKRIERRLKSLLFRSSRERLVHLLLELAEQYGTTVDDGVMISQKISHQDMASIIGATRETVTITLGELQSEGVLDITRRKMTLKNMTTLAGSIDFGPLRPSLGV